MANKNLLFRQLFDKTSSTYTYLLADKNTREAVIIDSVKEQAERDLKLIKELNLKLIYILETHIHADHVTGAHLLRTTTGAKTLVSKAARVDCSDATFGDGDIISFGSHKIKCLSTPGHTDSCTCFYVDGMVFTGDCLTIRGCGRTDFQQGSSETLYDSVKNKLFTLPGETIVYPAHDYKGMMSSTIAEERKHNARLADDIPREKFYEIMKNLNLSKPAQIDVALPANMRCGDVGP